MEATQQESLGVRLRRYREDAELGQAELARRVGVTPAHYWKVEHDKTPPSPLLLTALANALSVPVRDLTEDVAA